MNFGSALTPRGFPGLTPLPLPKSTGYRAPVQGEGDAFFVADRHSLGVGARGHGNELPLGVALKISDQAKFIT